MGFPKGRDSAALAHCDSKPPHPLQVFTSYKSSLHFSKEAIEFTTQSLQNNSAAQR
jgi:hypothetical protein